MKNERDNENKSFELYYNGGSIWCEHLDGMGACEDEVITKFLRDKRIFSRPSVSSFMIINLDETVITKQIVETIVSNVSESDKTIRKIAFVGVDKNWQCAFSYLKLKRICITFLSDYEKAKEWLYS